MRSLGVLALSALVFLNMQATSTEDRIQTIEEYNAQLPVWGTAWRPGNDAFGMYYPGFYTGFVMRQQTPQRIHVRTSRGNQTRVTVILDEQTLGDYLFDLVKRYNEIKKFSAKGGTLKIVSEKTAMPQAEYFFEVMESPVYGILEFVARAEAGQETKEAIYKKSLDVLKALNPGRIFEQKFDLAGEFTKWKATLAKVAGGKPNSEVFTADSKATVIALNTLLFGRINYVSKPSAEVIANLVQAADLAASGQEQAFLDSSLALFNQITGSKYSIKVLNDAGQFVSALDLNAGTLSYPEFTAIYATGSADAFTKDQFGNTIQDFATPGLWQFMSYKTSGRDFDNIREETFYGFAPKMDFEGIGNGFHNPAVSFGSPGKSVREVLNIRDGHTRWGAVKRGGVSHGCLRLPIGSVWELRHILPVQNEVATQVNFFGNASKDFDVFDINGDGQFEVMGVQYMVKYSVKGTSGLERREGGELSMTVDRKLEFYEPLYGKKNVFYVNGEQFVFTNPSISFPSHLDFKKKSVKTSWVMEGDYNLYEQAYERDKLQFFVPSSRAELDGFSNLPLSKRIVRLMGRIRGCAPDADKAQCGQAAYEKEAKGIWAEH